MEKQRSTAETEALWKERIAELEASGLTHKAWCTQNHIAMTTMRYWRRRLKKDKIVTENPKGFLRAVPVPDTAIAAPGAPVGRGITVKAIVIEFPEAGGTEAVREAVRALQSL